MRAYICQLNIAWEDKAANFARVEELLSQAAPPAGSLVVLPEMAFTGFSMNVAEVAKDEPERTEAFLAGIAAKLGIYLVAGVVTAAPSGRGRNEALYVSPEQGVTHRYQKLHLFSYAGEPSHYEPGQQVTVFDWRGSAVAPFICYDLRFPEIFRSGVDQGAELYTVIANWPRARQRHWLSLLQARAIENQAYVVGVNRCGADPKLDYSGRSLIVAPDGSIVADAGESEGVIGAELDFSSLREYRKSFPAVADRRPAPLAPAVSR